MPNAEILNLDMSPGLQVDAFTPVVLTRKLVAAAAEPPHRKCNSANRKFSANFTVEWTKH
jgi:hypothetical protein